MNCLKGLLLALLLLASPAWAGFNVKDLDGRFHTLADYKGKWVLVNFWATWCPPCLEEIPDLIALHDKHRGKDLVVIGIAMDYKSKKEIADFANDMLMSYPVVLGDDKVLKQFGSTSVLPTTYLYNSSGNLFKVHHGLITRSQVEKILSGK